MDRSLRVLELAIPDEKERGAIRPPARPPRSTLTQSMPAENVDPEPHSSHPWHFITNRAATLGTLRSLSAVAHATGGMPRSPETPTYLGFLGDDTDGAD